MAKVKTGYRPPTYSSVYLTPGQEPVKTLIDLAGGQCRMPVFPAPLYFLSKRPVDPRMRLLTQSMSMHSRRKSRSWGWLILFLIAFILAWLVLMAQPLPAAADAGHPERYATWTCIRTAAPSTHVCRVNGRRVYCHCYWRRVR